MISIAKNSNRRAGLSLAEVLIAIFVLSIGLMGILALFPLGAVRMAQAFKDDRTATLSNNVSAQMRWIWRDEVGVPGKTMYPVTPAPNAGLPLPPDHFDPLFNAMENVNYPWNPDLVPPYGDGTIPPVYQSTTTPPIPRSSSLPSYPVFVDPIGWNNPYNVGQVSQYWVGGDPRGIPRRSMRSIEFLRVPPSGYTQDYNALTPGFDAKMAMRHRYFVLMDDVGFSLDGLPYAQDGLTTAGAFPNLASLSAMTGQVQRDGRYSCGLLMRRPQNNSATNVELTIVVYSGRPMDAPSPETPFLAQFVQRSTEATIFYDPAGEKPQLRKGNWILDATMARQVNGQWVAEPHGYFYRIIDVTESGTDPITGLEMLTLELQNPAEMSTVFNGAVYGLGVVMDHVVEVFPGKALTANVRPVP